MNKNICKKVVENKQVFVPCIFTEKQVQIINKYTQNTPLTATEKVSLYSAIKKKIDALNALQEQWHVKGKNMLPERVKEAKKILQDLKKEKAFISGSFLHAKHYNDIDIFIVGTKRKQWREGKKNFICITENDLQIPLFYSCLEYCVANWIIEEIKPIIKRPSFDEILLTYQLVMKEIDENEDEKTIRSLLFMYKICKERTIPDSQEIYIEFQAIRKMKKNEKIVAINKMTKDLLLSLFSLRYTEGSLRPILNNMKKDIRQYKNNQATKVSYGLLEEIKHECRGAQKAVA